MPKITYRSAHTLPPGRERFGFSDSEANSRSKVRAAGGRKGKGHEPARTIPHATGVAQAGGGALAVSTVAGRAAVVPSGVSQARSRHTVSSATPSPAATARNGRLKMNIASPSASRGRNRGPDGGDSSPAG